MLEEACRHPREASGRFFLIFSFFNLCSEEKLVVTIKQRRIKRITIAYYIKKSLKLRPQTCIPHQEEMFAVHWINYPFKIATMYFTKAKTPELKGLTKRSSATNNMLSERISVSNYFIYISLHGTLAL